MNRDHVGMIFKFLPKEEQKELKSIDCQYREFYDTDNECWDYSTMNFLDENIAYRPKGFLSWNEIEEDITKRFKNKDIYLCTSGPFKLIKFGIHNGDIPYVTLKCKGKGNIDDYSISLDDPDYGFDLEKP